MKTQAIKKTPTKKRLILKNKFEKQELIEFSDFLLAFSIKLSDSFSIRFSQFNLNELNNKKPINFVERSDFSDVVLHNQYQQKKEQANILFKAYMLKYAIDKFLNYNNEVVKKLTTYKLNFIKYGNGQVMILHLNKYKIISIKDCNTQLDIKFDKQSTETDNILITDFFNIVSRNLGLFIKKYTEILTLADKQDVIKKFNTEIKKITDKN